MLDERPIFKGEIQKAPGMLQGAEEVAENILFSTDEEVLCAIEEHDLHDVNVNPTRELGTPPERLKTAGERPKTAGLVCSIVGLFCHFRRSLLPLP